MDKKIIPIFAILSVFGILFMLNYTSPLSAGVLGVLVFFTMVFIVIFAVMAEIVKIFQKILRDKRGRGNDSRWRGNNRTYMYATILSFGPILLMVLTRTHGGVDLVMMAGVVTTVVLGCFLVYKKA